VAFSPDGKLLATGSWDQTIKLWEVDTGRCRATLRGHRGRINSVLFDRAGQHVVSAGWDGTVRLWNVDGRGSRILIDHPGDIAMNLALAPDGATLAAAYSASGIHLWNVADQKERLRIPAPQMLAIAFAPDGKSLAATGMAIGFGIYGGNAGTVLFDAQTGQAQTTFRHPKCWGWSIAYAPDGKTLAVAQGENIVFLNPSAATASPRR
jgi:WD40 repeat protein